MEARQGRRPRALRRVLCVFPHYSLRSAGRLPAGPAAERRPAVANRGGRIKNVAEEARMVDAMRRGADLNVKGTSDRGTQW
jgi:hypothetical protein